MARLMRKLRTGASRASLSRRSLGEGGSNSCPSYGFAPSSLPFNSSIMPRPYQYRNPMYRGNFRDCVTGGELNFTVAPLNSPPFVQLLPSQSPVIIRGFEREKSKQR